MDYSEGKRNSPFHSSALQEVVTAEQVFFHCCFRIRLGVGIISPCTGKIKLVLGGGSGEEPLLQGEICKGVTWSLLHVSFFSELL